MRAPAAAGLGDRGRTRLARGMMTVGVLAVLGLAAPGEGGASGDREPDIERGAKLVEARCLRCHKAESLPAFVQRCAERRGPEYLEAFLKRHYAPDDEARADIIAFLTCEPGQPPEN